LLQYPEMSEHHLSLVVSGGHTLLIEVEEIGKYAIIGQTRDDAAGEAFDKVAKLLDLGYPGGAKLDAIAKNGNAQAIKFPRAVIKDEPFTFSFSGLKTAVALYIEKLSPEERQRQLPDIAASFQEAVVDVLVDRTLKAAKEKRLSHVSLSGGVAANSRLRTVMQERLAQAGCQLFVPPMSLCTDNAAMIAAAGYFRYQAEGASEYAVNAVPYLPLVSWR
jgi:N6-L-threonylcarbamoyladenine synthase